MTKRKNKKVKLVKTELQRIQETQHIKNMINQLGLGEGNPDVKIFYEQLDTFTKTGISWSGKITLHGHKRVIDAILTTKPNVTSNITIRYDPSK